MIYLMAKRSTAALAVIMMIVAGAPHRAAADPLPAGIPDNVKEFDVNGIHVIMRPSGPANHVVVAKLFIRGGTSVLPSGVSPAVEDLSLQLPPLSGPQGTDRAAYQRELQRMVTTIAPAMGRDFSTMTLRCVDETFDRSWELFSGVILRPVIDPIELRNAKDRTITALRNRQTSPEAYASYLADSAYFAGHPYGRFAQEGDIPPLDSATLINHYKELFVKSRLLLVVVGTVDSANVAAKVASSLAKLPQGSYHDPVIPAPPNASKSTLIVKPPYGGGRVVTNYIVARYPAPSRTDSLYYPMMRLTSFLSGSLFREVRIERNLSYAPDADVTNAASSYGEITISTTLPDSAWRVARGEVVDFFREYVIDSSYIRSGLSSWITSTYMREQTNESQADELGRAKIYTGDWRKAYGVVEGISNITAEQMNEAARKYLANMTIVVVGDPNAVTRSEFLSQGSTATQGK
jgi:zinc protease